MTARRIEGSVIQHRCRRCEACFPSFIFSGDTDMATAALAYAVAFDGRELVLAEMTPAEYAAGEQGGSLVERRLADLLQRDLRVPHLLRYENGPTGEGLSFQEFSRIYRPPTAVLACIACLAGEAPEVESLSPVEFQAVGGEITLLDHLVLADEA